MQKKNLIDAPNSNSVIKNVVRGPVYLCGVLVLLFSTVLIFVAMFTNNWQRKVSTENTQEFFTYGLWFTCRNIRLEWIENHHDLYCFTTDFSNCRIC